MPYVIGYLSLCLGISALIWKHVRECFEEQAQEDRVAAILTWLTMALLSPIWFPVLWVITTFQDWKHRRRVTQFARKYVEPEMTPVNFFELDKPTRDWFQTATETMLQLGFDLVGDFQYRTQPFHIVDRIFLSADQQVLGTAVMADGERSVDMESLDETGTLIDSSSLDHKLFSELPDKSDLYVLNFVTGGAIMEVYERHRELLAERDRRIYRLPLQNCREIVVFAARRLSQWDYRLGKKVERPPEPVLPAGCELASVERAACVRAIDLPDPPAHQCSASEEKLPYEPTSG